MKKIAIAFILVGFLLVFVSYIVPFNSGQVVFTKSISLPQAIVRNNLEIPHLEQDKYEIVLQIISKKGVSKPKYKISIEDESKRQIWSNKGALYSEYSGSKQKELIKKVSYGLGPVEINKSGRYTIFYQLFWSENDGLIDSLSFSIKKNTILIPNFVVNTSLTLVLIGLFLLLFLIRKKT